MGFGADAGSVGVLVSVGEEHHSAVGVQAERGEHVGPQAHHLPLHVRHLGLRGGTAAAVDLRAWIVTDA